MTDGACWADVFAPATEDDAAVRVYGGLFFAVCCFGFEGLHVAEFDAFATCGAFAEVDFGVPGNFVAGDSFVLGFGHVFPYKTIVYNNF